MMPELAARGASADESVLRLGGTRLYLKIRAAHIQMLVKVYTQ